MKHRLTLLLFVLLMGKSLYAQEAIPWIVKDSLELPKDKILQYDILTNASPVLLLPAGLYLPKEKIWYYKPTDTSIRLNSFALSEADTSLYLISTMKDKLFFLNLRNNANGVSEQNSLLQLPFGYWYEISPLPASTYFLAQSDSVCKLFKGTFDRVEKWYETKEKLLSVMAIDANAALLVFPRRISYCANGTEKTLFNSPLPIVSAVVATKGRMYVATGKGVFEVHKDLSTTRLPLAVSDGMLRVSGNNLYVLSNRRQKLYTVLLP